MSGELAIRLEGLLIVVGLVVFCVWQLVSLKRDQRALQARREAERRQAAEAPAADDAAPPER